MRKISWIAAIMLFCLPTFPGRALSMSLEEAKTLILEYADAEGAAQAERARALDSLKKLSEVIPPEQAYKIVLTSLQMRKSADHKRERGSEDRRKPDSKGIDIPPARAQDTPSKNTEVPSGEHQREDKPASRATNEEHAVKSSSDKIPQNPAVTKKSEKCWIIENSLKVNTVKSDSFIEPVLIRPTFGIDECAQK